MFLQVLALFFGSSLIAFMISVSSNSRKANISLLLKRFFIVTDYSAIFVDDDCVSGFTFNLCLMLKTIARQPIVKTNTNKLYSIWGSYVFEMTKISFGSVQH